MSSFVIEKKEYIKAAGFCAALAERKKPGADQWLRVWDPAAGHVAEGEDFARYFAYLYKLNAESVFKQYAPRHPGEVLATDENDYKTAFNAAKAATASAWIDAERGSGKIRDMILGFYTFSRSVLYQIEDEAAAASAAEFLNKICADLLPILARWSNTTIDDMDFWGCFTL